MKPENKKPKRKSAFREWLDSVMFAVIAATLIRFFLFEAYTIPTPSMEGSLMVGDFLFVSKLHYGVRTPKTPLQLRTSVLFSARTPCLLHPLKRWIGPKSQDLGHFFGRYHQGHSF